MKQSILVTLFTMSIALSIQLQASDKIICARLVLSQDGIDHVCINNLGDPKEELFVHFSNDTDTRTLSLEKTEVLEEKKNFSDTFLVKENQYKAMEPIAELANSADLVLYHKNNVLGTVSGAVQGAIAGKPGISRFVAG